MDHCGDVSVAEMVTYADDNGWLPIHWALMGYRDEWYGSAPETSKDEDPIPPRMINTVKLLLKAKPDTINARSDQGATVFNYAVKSDTGLANITILVNMLLGAKPLASTLSYYNPACPTALQDTVDNHSRRFGGLDDGKLFELLEKLLANGVDARFCLHRLCDGMWRGKSISTVLIERLLKGTVINDTDANGCTPMHYLIKRMDQIDAIRYLIKLGADVNVMDHKGNMPLHEVMKGVMMSKVDENGVRGPSQLWDSPYSRREELAKILVDAGGWMDQPNEAGQTPTQLLDEKREERRRQEVRRLQSITR